jgi:lysozyme
MADNHESSATRRVAAVARVGSGAVIAICVAFTPMWEGMDSVARVDAIGTGHPVTYCYGQTDEFGKVQAGARFTKAECDAKLRESFEKTYYPGVHACVKVSLPVKTEAALVDAGFNAGVAAVCRSSILAKMNAGDLVGGCNAFAGWRVTASGKVYAGLIKRRGPGDWRKSEKQLCLEGVAEGIPQPPKPVAEPGPWARFVSFLFNLFKLFGG